MKGRITILFVFAAMAVGCGQGKKAEQFKALPFPDVVPPEMMSDPSDRAEYLAEHYWDRLIDPAREYPSDSLLLCGVRRGDIEQKFADWTSILDMVPRSSADRSISSLYDRTVAFERKGTVLEERGLTSIMKTLSSLSTIN